MVLIFLKGHRLLSFGVDTRSKTDCLFLLLPVGWLTKKPAQYEARFAAIRLYYVPREQCEDNWQRARVMDQRQRRFIFRVLIFHLWKLKYSKLNGHVSRILVVLREMLHAMRLKWFPIERL